MDPALLKDVGTISIVLIVGLIFLLAIGWCLGVAEAASALGLSEEIGAFIAGVTIATSPISLYIADHLKPLRDFFLILFFFSLGAGFHMDLLGGKQLRLPGPLP